MPARWPVEQEKFLMEHYGKDMTTKEIAKNLGKPPYAVWIKASRLRRKIYTIKRVVSPSPECVYLIGVRFGDGFVTNNGRGYREFRVSTTDIKFAKKVQEAIVKVVGKARKIYVVKNPKGTWTKKDIYDVGTEIKDLVDIVDRNIDKLIPWIERYPEKFIEGLFDSEGSIYLDDGKYLRLEIGITNKKVLDIAYQLLIKLGFHPRFNIGKTPLGRPYYRLRLHNQQEVKKFLKTVNTLKARRGEYALCEGDH